MYENLDYHYIEPYVELTTGVGVVHSVKLEPMDSIHNNANEEPLEKGKKRRRNEENWKKNVTKKARLEGLPYHSHVAKKVTEMGGRVLKPPCKCRAKCYDRLTEASRQQIFDDFWKKCNNWEQRRQFVANRVTKELKVRTKVNSSWQEDRRKFNYRYSLEVKDREINVCKVMFLNTLSIGEKYVKISVEKKTDSGITEGDRRGRHQPANKIPESTIQSIKEHVTAHPIYKSNVTKKSRQPGTDLNKSLMYSQYKESMIQQGKTEKDYAKEWLYRAVLNKMYKSSLGNKKGLTKHSENDEAY